MNPLEILKPLFKEIKAEAKIIPVKKIVLHRWTRLKCMHGCEMFGKSWSCPPATPDFNEAANIISEYRRAFMIKLPGSLETQIKLQPLLLEMEKKLVSSGFYKAFVFFSAACGFCKKCSYPEPCRKPVMKRPTLESFGIDVFETAKKAGFSFSRNHYFTILLLE